LHFDLALVSHAPFLRRARMTPIGPPSPLPFLGQLLKLGSTKIPKASSSHSGM
jgi:hypothetical protein